MAEKKTDPPKAPTEPTERVVLAGFGIAAEQVAKALVEAGFGQTTDTRLGPGDDARRKKVIEETQKLLTAGEDGDVLVYVEIATAHNGDKRKAIESCVGEGTLGTYRAPSRKAWKDGVRKKPPVQIAPDVEMLA